MFRESLFLAVKFPISHQCDPKTTLWLFLKEKGEEASGSRESQSWKPIAIYLTGQS
jgi:hypothetical protein